MTFQKRMIFFLFLLLPVHVLVIYAIKYKFNFSINEPVFILIKSWKEAVAIIILLGCILRFKRIGNKGGGHLFDIMVIFNLLLGVIYLLFSTDNLLLGIWSFRSLYVIYFFYFLGRLVPLNIVEVRRLIFFLYIIAALTAVFGIIQVEVLGADFQFAVYGADEVGVNLQAYNYGKLRATSTFINPHEFGLFLVLALFSIPFILSDENLSPRKRKSVILLAVIIMAGLGYSFSRSSLIILAVGYSILLIKNKKYLPIAFAVLFILGIVLAYLQVADNLQVVMDGRDPSSIGHVNAINDAFSIVSQNPMGIGLGKAGVVVRRFDPSAPQFEGELFNILVQLGVLCTGLFLFIQLGIFWMNIKNKWHQTGELKSFSMFVAMVTIGLLFRNLILPQDQMNFWYGWFLLGAGVRLNTKRKYGN